jgi:hypothetical protein
MAARSWGRVAVPVLWLKVAATPLLMVLVSLAGRRFGHGVGGWLTGLPLTSGPVSLFLAVEQGPAFARDAAPGMLAGFLAFLAFLAAVAWAAPRSGWRGTLAAGLAAFAVVELPLLWVRLPLWVGFAAAVLAVAALLAALRHRPATVAAPPPPRWDLPVRALCATAMVVGVTGLAAWLGPHAAGLLSPLPAFASVVVGFTHSHAGGAAAREVARGIAAGAFSFAAFFLVVGLVAGSWGLLATYGAASAAALLCNAATLRLARAPAGAPAPADLP